MVAHIGVQVQYRTNKLRLRYVSRKIRQNNRGLAYYITEICMIGLLGEGNVSYVLPAHSEMLILPMEYLLERKEQ